MYDDKNKKVLDTGYGPKDNAEKPTVEDASAKGCYVACEFQNKCIKLFFEAIKTHASSHKDEEIALVSSRIVSYMAKINKLSDSKFVRSKLLNLRDKGNPQLSNNICNNVISPERFVEMTLEEMKSENLKKAESEMHKNCLLKMQIAEPQAETGMFECSKCKQKKCSYFQLQTRSADEPMTTYVKCICGHKWKFT